MGWLRRFALGIVGGVVAAILVAAVVYGKTSQPGIVAVDTCQLLEHSTSALSIKSPRSAWVTWRHTLIDVPRSEVSTCNILAVAHNTYAQVGLVRPGRDGYTSANDILDELVDWPRQIPGVKEATVPSIGEKALQTVMSDRPTSLIEVHVAARQGAYAVQVDLCLDGLTKENVIDLAQGVAVDLLAALPSE